MNVLQRPLFRQTGGMIHDQRTLRNVDDEIYRIAPKTYDRGAVGRDARDEYGRDLREKRYLHHQMNRMANGGDVAPMGMMPPPPMGGPPMGGPMPPPMGGIPPEVLQTEMIADQEGQAFGQAVIEETDRGIDMAEDPKQLIDAMRGNSLPLEARYQELATIVGPEDAFVTPESVLTLTQPALMIAEQETDQGIGQLMEEVAGDVPMEAGLPMGMGVGELMMEAPAGPPMGGGPPMSGLPVPVRHGGPIKKFQDGKGVNATPTGIEQLRGLDTEALLGMISPGTTGLGGDIQSDYNVFKEYLALTPEEEAWSDRQVWLDVIRRGLSLAAGTSPDTQERMKGDTLSQSAQAFATLPTTIAQAQAPRFQADRAARAGAVQSGLARRTAREGYGAAFGSAMLQEQLYPNLTPSKLKRYLLDPYWSKYVLGQTSPEDSQLVELAINEVKKPVFRMNPETGSMEYTEPTPIDYVEKGILQRQQSLQDMTARNQLPGEQPVIEQEEITTLTDVAPDMISTAGTDYLTNVLGEERVNEVFGTRGFFSGFLDDVEAVVGDAFGADASQDRRERDRAESAMRDVADRAMINFLSLPNIRNNQATFDLFLGRVPKIESFLTPTNRAVDDWYGLLRDAESGLEAEKLLFQRPEVRDNPQARIDSQGAQIRVEGSIGEMKQVICAMEKAGNLTDSTIDCNVYGGSTTSSSGRMSADDLATARGQ